MRDDKAMIEWSKINLQAVGLENGTSIGLNIQMKQI